MTQFTPTLNLTKPGGGSTGMNMPPDRVDIDVLNDNFDKLDARAALVGDNLNRSFAYFGTAAGIGSISPAPKDGDTYQESNGAKRLWKRVGGVWVSGEAGSFLIRAGGVVGGSASIADDGEILLGGASTYRITDCFSSRFDRYRVVIEFIGNSAAIAPTLRWHSASGGGDLTDAGYLYARNYNAAAVATAVQANGQTSFEINAGTQLSNGTAFLGIADLLVDRPSVAFSTSIQGTISTRVTATAINQGTIAGVYTPTTLVTGFLLVAAANFNARVKIQGF